MGIRFIIGRAGSGKTKHCFDAIVSAMRDEPLGPAIYWILPKQATFSAERELTTLSGLGGFSRARVLSFDLLGEEVLASCGGAGVPRVSALGRQMLLGFLLRKHQNDLRFFRSVARQPGLAARLDATFAEFERCGKDESDLANLLEELGPQADDVERSVLREKMADFHLLYRAYRRSLGDERVDPHRRLEQVLKCIADHKALRGASVFIDGFLDFSDRERRMIAAMGKACDRVEITLLCDPASPTLRDPHQLPDDLSLFHRTESTYRQLALMLAEQGVRTETPLALKSTSRFTEPALSAIESSLFADAPIASDVEDAASSVAADAIELVEAPDRRGEVDAAARRIASLLRQGKRLRDIAVLVRDVDEYEPLITAAFAEHGLHHFFVDRRRAAAHHPLLQLLRSLLIVLRQNWPHDAVMAMLKSGLAGVSLDDAEELENYCLLHRIKGPAWTDRQAWSYQRTLRREEDADETPAQRANAERMNNLRLKLVDAIRPLTPALAGPQSLKRTVVQLFGAFNKLSVPQTLKSWIDAAIASNDPEQRGEHEQVWFELVELFDQMVDLLGEEPVSLPDFVEILEAGLEQFDLALPPARIDQVLVGQVDRSRTTRVDTAIVLGLSEGQFPKIGREDSVLSDAERRSLRNMHLEVDPDSERRLLDENLLGYIAFTRASRHLIVTRATSEQNKPIGPSAHWTRLRRLFPELSVTTEQREDKAKADAIATPRQLVSALMRWARSKDADADAQQPWASLYHWLIDHACCDDAIDTMRYRAWRALSYTNNAILSADTAQKLAGRQFYASVTRIETFATCPFKHFARHHLGLEPREDANVTPMDLGTVYHSILEGVVQQTLQNRSDWCEVEKQITAKQISDLAERAGHSLRGELMLSSARNKYLLSRIRKNLAQVCAAQQRVLSRGQFRPAFAELEFGLGDRNNLPALALKTPKGREVLLRGKIDRVDLLQSGTTAAVVDYKMRDQRLSLHEVYYGLSLQLLTYLLVLEASGEKLFGKKVTPVAAFYAKLLRNLDSIDHPDDAPDETDPAFDLRVKPRGIFDGKHVTSLDGQLQSGASEVVAAYITKDGNFGRIDSTDVADSRQFTALLGFVRQRISELADRMIDGIVDVTPYRIGKETPCTHCDYRSVCRFDAAVNPYLILNPMKRSEVLERVAGGNRGD